MQKHSNYRKNIYLTEERNIALQNLMEKQIYIVALPDMASRYLP